MNLHTLVIRDSGFENTITLKTFNNPEDLRKELLNVVCETLEFQFPQDSTIQELLEEFGIHETGIELDIINHVLEGKTSVGK